MTRLILLSALLSMACSTAPAPEPAASPTAGAADPQSPASHQESPGAPTPSDSQAPQWSAFGATFAPVDPIPLAGAVARGDELIGQTVTVQGRISEVCQKAGCWMVLSDDSHHVRVRMKDHDFAVDKGSATKIGQVQGEWIARQVDAAEVDHYAAETREGGVVPEQNREGPVYEIVANSVRIAKN